MVASREPYASAREGDSGPQVSVAVPTHNRAGLLGRAIKSTLAQTFADYKLMAVDEG